MKFILILILFFQMGVAQSQADESPKIQSKQCLEGEGIIVECQCYKSWADRYPEIWNKITLKSTGGEEYISVGMGTSENLARQDAKSTCNLMFKSFLRDFVENADLNQAYEVDDEYCSRPVVCE